MSNYMTDLSNLVSVAGTQKLAKHSTTKNKDNTSLDMTDFLQLMVVQLQNQGIDNAADPSDMLNQMVQMQMITAMTNMTEASIMSYASSMVGKEVTIGDYSSGELVEKVVTITGSGMADGQAVVFAGDDVYSLSSIMAIGRLPSLKEPEKPGDTDTKPTDPVEPTDPKDPAEDPKDPAEDPKDPVDPADPKDPADPNPPSETDPDPDKDGNGAVG
ncbi:MAG: hypothetical protein HFF50_08790 [Lawsonibacter sp.]|nr:hypothetical protein [Lawsonibacter sp.]